MQKVDPSVIIPTYDGVQRLPQSLEHIVAYLAGQGRDFEIVVGVATRCARRPTPAAAEGR
jgi:hypothetical protein